jgi:hypothetical protein
MGWLGGGLAAERQGVDMDQHMGRRGEQRWTSEAFLRDACDAMALELDWDTIDSGRLHRASCAARTVDGLSVVVAVLDNEGVLSSVLEDARDERRETGQASTPLWLYAPIGIDLQVPVDEKISIRRVDSGPRKGRRTSR